MKVLTVTSPQGGQETGECAGRLAIAMAMNRLEGRNPMRTVLIDLDANGTAARVPLGPQPKPRTSKLLDVATGKTLLCDLLTRKDMTLVDGRGVQSARQVTLMVIAPDPSLLDLEADRPRAPKGWLRQAIASLKDFDIVLLHAPALRSSLSVLAREASDRVAILIGASPHVAHEVRALAPGLDRRLAVSFLLLMSQHFDSDAAAEQLQDAVDAAKGNGPWAALKCHLAPMVGFPENLSPDCLDVANELARALTESSRKSWLAWFR